MKIKKVVSSFASMPACIHDSCVLMYWYIGADTSGPAMMAFRCATVTSRMPSILTSM